MKTAKKSPTNSTKNLFKQEIKNPLDTAQKSKINQQQKLNNENFSYQLACSQIKENQKQGGQLFTAKKVQNNYGVLQQSQSHHTNKSASNLQALIPKTQQTNSNSLFFESQFDILFQKQQELESYQQQEIQEQKQEIISLKEKFENLEQLFQKFLKLIFDKQYQLETTINKIDQNKSKSISKIINRLENAEQIFKLNKITQQNEVTYDQQPKELQNISNQFMNWSNINKGGNLSCSNRLSGDKNSFGSKLKANKDQLIDMKQQNGTTKMQRNSSFLERQQKQKSIQSQKHFTENNESNTASFIGNINQQVNSQKSSQNKNQTQQNQTLSKSNSSRNIKGIKNLNENTSLKQKGQKFGIVPEKKIFLHQSKQRESNLKKNHNLMIQNENVPVTEVFSTLEIDSYDHAEPVTLNNKQDQQLKYKSKNQLINNYQKNVPKGGSPTGPQIQRPQTSNDRRGNLTQYNVQQPQNSLIAQNHNKYILLTTQQDNHMHSSPTKSSLLSHSSASSQEKRESLNCCQSLMYQGDDNSCSPKFMGFINKSDQKIINPQSSKIMSQKLQKPQIQIDKELQDVLGIQKGPGFNIDAADTIDIETFHNNQNQTSQFEKQMFDTMLSAGGMDINEFEEVKKPISLQIKEETKNSIKNIAANSVYESKNMQLSRFISTNKSNIDFKNNYNKVELRNITEFMLQKGNRCQCTKSQLQQVDEDADICSDFCKKLNAKQEREIIKRLILVDQEFYDKKETKQNFSPNQGRREPRILAPCSRSRSPVEKSDNKLNLSTSNAQTQPEKKYIINAKWWRGWCDYVNFETQTPKSKDQQLSDDIQQRRQILLKLHADLQNQEASLKNNLKTVYPKPSTINNQLILKEGRSIELKEDLIEHFDYIVVSCDIWKHLYSWYSADFTIVRFMKRDKTNIRVKVLDLYPEQRLYEVGYHEERESEMFESESEQQNDQDVSNQIS